MININPGLKKILTVSMTRPKNGTIYSPRARVYKTQSDIEICSCGKESIIFLKSFGESFIVSFCNECWLKNEDQSNNNCIPISKKEAIVYAIMWA
jgi:hypothetical protein